MPAGADDIPDIDPAALARAEAALAALSERYLAWAGADVARLVAGLDGLRAGDGGSLAEVFAIAHDIKGQAATFGYPLVTAIANRLCRLIEAGPADITAIAAHVDAIAAAVAQRLGGDGGDEGRRLLRRLEG